MSELRQDALTGARVIVAPGRSARPNTFRSPRRSLPAADSSCPFCVGNEAQTPPEVARTGGGPPDRPGWRVRVVPNKFPLVGHGVPGAHEVVVLSTAHDRTFADLDAAAATEVLAVIRDRAAHHLSTGCAHAHAFINHGEAGGASIEHPHAQVLALAFTPPFVESMLVRFARAGRDLVTVAIDEIRETHFVIVDGPVVVWCPPASIAPYAVRLAIPSSGGRFDRAADEEVAALAAALGDALRRIRSALGDAPYNAVLNTGPAVDTRPFHWWVDVHPRLTIAAGFEAATGLDICTVEPEKAAGTLRENA
jgi:UDPglucose--hexose-1-phosphate uridylyltransferase